MNGSLWNVQRNLVGMVDQRPRGFDGRALSFLWIEYAALVERVKQGGSDEEILAWAVAQGTKVVRDSGAKLD